MSHAKTWREPTSLARHGAALALVVGVAVWPIAHRVLVETHEIHPWKLGGFAMYTTYATTKVALFEPRATGFRLIDERDLPAGAQAALRDVRGERSALGAFREPDPLARAVFASRPGLDQLLVVVQRLWLDAETAQVDSSKTHFPYERADLERR